MPFALALALVFGVTHTQAQHHHRPAAHAPHQTPSVHARPAPAKAHGKANKAAPAKDAGKSKGGDEVEAVEQIEQVEPVEAVENVDAKVGDAAGGVTEQAKATAQDPARSIAAVLGHLHAAVVHLPIAWSALWSFFEALSLLWPHPWLIMSGLPLGIVTVLSFGPAVYTGLARLDELAAASPSYDMGPAHLHRNLLFLAWALCGLACALRLTAARPGRGFSARAAYLMLVWIAFAVTGWSAHLGGCMVYGDDFLPF